MLTITKSLLAAVIALAASSCSNEEVQAQTATYMDINITVSGKALPVHLVDNSATRALVTALQQSPITYEADDYGGFEKVGSLGHSLPTGNRQITTEAGDVILYNGNQIVLFYGTNSWSYTRLGRIEFSSLDALKQFLKAGQGRISVTLSLPESTGIKTATASSRQDAKVYALNGTRLKQEPTKGIYIKDGRKSSK